MNIKTKNTLLPSQVNNWGIFIIDNIDAMMAYWDKNQLCKYANKAYVDWFGKKPEDIIEKMTLKELLGDVLYQKNLPYITSVLAGNKQVFERDIQIPSGEIFNSIACYHPHLINDEVVGFFVHVANITKVKEIERQLISSLEREQLSNKINAKLIAMASHEVRTPLSTISASVSLINQYNHRDKKDKIEEHIKKIQTVLKNLNDIVNDFLNMDKPLNYITQEKYQNFELPSFINNVISEIQSLLDPNRKIIYSHSGILEILHGKQIIQSIMVNLLSNAIKYSEKNKPIYVYTDIQDKEIGIKVIDNGIGIPQDDQNKLFQFFFRASNVTDIEGTGLGLVIVKRYIDFLNGKISIKSDVGIGTEIYIKLPLVLDLKQILLENP